MLLKVQYLASAENRRTGQAHSYRYLHRKYQPFGAMALELRRHYLYWGPLDRPSKCSHLTTYILTTTSGVSFRALDALLLPAHLITYLVFSCSNTATQHGSACLCVRTCATGDVVAFLPSLPTSYGVPSNPRMRSSSLGLSCFFCYNFT